MYGFAAATCCCLSEPDMRRVRGNEIGMIFQEPMSSLNPLLTAGEQIAEVVRLHQGTGQGGGTAPCDGDAGTREHPRS